jgi:formate/nitrite transporter
MSELTSENLMGESVKAAPFVTAKLDQYNDSAPVNPRDSKSTLPRGYNMPAEVEQMVANVGEKKSTNTLDKTIYLGFLAGLFVSIAGITAMVAASGIDPAIAAANPFVPRFIFSAIFPCGLFFIVLFGGDLFTGNTMLLTVSFLHGKITLADLLKNWVFVFTFNFLGCAFGAYVFGYLGEMFTTPNAILYVQNFLVRKAALPLGVVFVRAIAANGMVCLAIFLGLTARDVIGKLYGLWVPVFMFAMCGFEHCVANMFYFTLGLLHGAPVTAGQFAANIVVVTLGNIVGGAFLVGCSEYYLYHWQYSRSPRILNSSKVKVGLPARVIMQNEDSKEVVQMRQNVNACLWNTFCSCLSCCGKHRKTGANNKAATQEENVAEMEMEINVS